MWFRQKLKIEEKQYHAKNLERTLKRLYTCRDLEISNLWQRSIFLGAFLILCFTGYGILFMKLSESYSNICINLGAIFLGLLGWLFSYIWILMAKGSKAWYEVYETYITKFENEYYEREYLDIPDDFIMGEKIETKGIDISILTTKAGAFSVSKVNILIGQISALSWIVILLIHIYLLTYLILSRYCYSEEYTLIIMIGSLIFSIISIIAFTKLVSSILKKKAKSGVLTKAMNSQ